MKNVFTNFFKTFNIGHFITIVVIISGFILSQSVFKKETEIKLSDSVVKINKIETRMEEIKDKTKYNEYKTDLILQIVEQQQKILDRLEKKIDSLK
jgi:hypothetical protein